MVPTGLPLDARVENCCDVIVGFAHGRSGLLNPFQWQDVTMSAGVSGCVIQLLNDRLASIIIFALVTNTMLRRSPRVDIMREDPAEGARLLAWVERGFHFARAKLCQLAALVATICASILFLDH